jgi:hypothetical protein
MSRSHGHLSHGASLCSKHRGTTRKPSAAEILTDSRRLDAFSPAPGSPALVGNSHQSERPGRNTPSTLPFDDQANGDDRGSDTSRHDSSRPRNDGRKDFDALVAHLVVTALRAEAALSPAARSENPGAPPLTSGARSPGTDPPAAGITLSWSDTEPGPSPIDLPGTSAFFLSHFEIIPGEQGAWWEGATWQELFSSRIANPGKERGR